jgi:uncharacterized membrane-anchored protein YitT (DUF2179 family)/predicted metal-dependent HD superfamily phosphohydrolase
MKSLEAFVFDLLEEKKSEHLFYHDKEHTQEVLAAALHIAHKEGINEDEMLLLKTAALLHDVGYVFSPAEHEKKSCEIAKEILPQYNFTPPQIERICRMIMATKIPQKPLDYLSQILCDADLSYLGTDSYKEHSEKLFKELRSFNQELTRDKWLHQQIHFLSSHRFFTASAGKEFNQKKKRHLSALKSQLPVRQKTGNYKLMSIAEDAGLIILGILFYSFALNSFLVPNNFFDGGVSGISLLIHEIYHFNLAYVVAVVNLPFIILARNIVDTGFAFKTALCIALLSLSLFFIPFPKITSDNVLVAVFGGFFLGIGNGLIMRAGSSLDGIEIFALYTRRRTSFTTTEIILLLNFIIFLVCAVKFNIQTAMYSMLTYFTASKTMDYVVEGIEAYTGVTIISGKSELLKDRLVNELGRGITIYKGERGYLPGNFEVHNDTDIIFTVITRLEIRRLKEVVYETDPAAFVFASVIKEASGGILKKRKAQHEAKKTGGKSHHH